MNRRLITVDDATTQEQLRSHHLCASDRRSHRGREKGGRGGKRASDAGHSRSLAVTAGHLKMHPDQRR